MMKKTLLLIMCVLTALGVSAQGNLAANQRLVGYTVNDDIDINGAMVGQAGTYPIGAVLTPQVLSAYKGCRIVGIRLASAVDLGRTRIFLDGVTDNKLTELHAQRQRIYEGWNEVMFNGDGIEITGDRSLFYGFDYVETQEMIDNEKGGICSVGTDTDNAFVLYLGGRLNTVSQVGQLCVQLIVDVSNLPADNMVLGFFDTGFKYKRKGEPVEIYTLLTNVGRDDISSYRMACQFDNDAVQYFDVTGVSVAPSTQTTWQQQLTAPEAIGSHTLTCWVDRVNSTTIERVAEHDKKVSFAVFVNTLPRNGAYMEVYTDQTSPYTAMLEPLLSGLSDETVIVNVHAPETELGADYSDILFDLYAYTRPSFTVNRAYFPGEKNFAYDLNDYLGMLPDAFLSAMLEDIVAQDATTASFAGIGLTSTYNPSTRLLTVDATGDVLPEAEAIYGDIALTLMAVEDGVIAPQVKPGANNQLVTDATYSHDNVLRGYITPPLGRKLTVDGARYNSHVEFTVPEDWDASKLRVVGLLTKAADMVTADDLHDMDVINVAATRPAEASVGSITADSAAQVEAYYTLQGVRLGNDSTSLPAGIYIRRYTDGTADKVSIK